jgi:FtsZ-binding cell division protein ZapB
MFKEMFQETDKRLQAAQATIADLQGQLKEMTESQKRCWNEWTLAEQNVESLQQRVAQLEKERQEYMQAATNEPLNEPVTYGALKAARFVANRAFQELVKARADHARVLGLVQALCPSEGCTFTVSKERDEDDLYSVYVDINGQGYGSCAEFYSRQEALAYVAIRTYRASLPAQPAQGGA